VTVDLSAVRARLDEFDDPDEAIEAALEGLSGDDAIEAMAAIVALLDEAAEPDRVLPMHARVVNERPTREGTAKLVLESLVALAEEDRETSAERARAGEALFVELRADSLRPALVALHALANDDEDVVRHALAIDEPSEEVAVRRAEAELRIAHRAPPAEAEALARAVIERRPGTREHVNALALLSRMHPEVVGEGAALARRLDDAPVHRALLAFLFGPVSDDLSFLVPESEIREASYGVPRIPGDPRVFGPTRDFACACGKYDGFEHVDLVCEVCGVECATTALRTHRFGHRHCASPLLHPAGRRLLALLLECGEGDVTDDLREVIASFDFDDVDRELDIVRFRTELPVRPQLASERANAIAALRSLGRPLSTLWYEVLPVPPPDVALDAHPRLAAIDRDAVARAPAEELLSITWPRSRGSGVLAPVFERDRDRDVE
jgi:hypothetical protein